MPERNSRELTELYASLADQFSRLDALRSTYTHWARMGRHCEETPRKSIVEGLNLETASDFDGALRSVELKQDALDESLPRFCTVGCVSVSLAPFKAALTAQLKRLREKLIAGARAAAESAESELSEFVRRATTIYSRTPSSVTVPPPLPPPYPPIPPPYLPPTPPLLPP